MTELTNNNQSCNSYVHCLDIGKEVWFKMLLKLITCTNVTYLLSLSVSSFFFFFSLDGLMRPPLRGGRNRGFRLYSALLCSLFRSSRSTCRCSGFMDSLHTEDFESLLLALNYKNPSVTSCLLYVRIVILDLQCYIILF